MKPAAANSATAPGADGSRIQVRAWVRIGVSGLTSSRSLTTFGSPGVVLSG